MVINNKGLTLLEILVAMLILALVIGGLGNIFTSSKLELIHTRSLMLAAELARYFLDPLQADVRNDTWGSSWLSTSGVYTGEKVITTQNTPGAFNYSYNSSYNITNNAPISNLTKVVLNITWNELTF